MSASDLLDYIQSQKVAYMDRSRDNQWANYRVGREFKDNTGIGTSVLIQLRTPADGQVRAQLIVIDRNNEVIRALEKDLSLIHI